MKTVHKAVTEKADKKPVDRSAENPAISIEKAIELVNNVSKNFAPTQWVTRDDIEAVLKNKWLHRHIAASVQYGVLVRDKNKYQISPIYKELINPLSQQEVKRIRVQFFKSPKLYADLIEKYNEHVVPTDLKVHLVRFHKIAANASAEVADLFFENARFAGVISDSNILNINDLSSVSETPPADPKVNPGVEVQNPVNEEEAIKRKQFEEAQERIRQLEEINNPITYKIPLSEKRAAILTYPQDLNVKDIQILQKYIELLELSIN